jgi:hypothetical protein
VDESLSQRKSKPVRQGDDWLGRERLSAVDLTPSGTPWRIMQCGKLMLDAVSDGIPFRPI